MMDINSIALWLSVALSIVALLGHLKTFFGSGEAANAKKLEATESKLIDHDRRIQTVEGELKHLPDKDMVMELKLAIAELKGTVGALGDTVSSMSHTVHRIDDYLREQTKP